MNHTTTIPLAHVTEFDLWDIDPHIKQYSDMDLGFPCAMLVIHEDDLGNSLYQMDTISIIKHGMHCVLTTKGGIKGSLVFEKYLRSTHLEPADTLNDAKEKTGSL